VPHYAETWARPVSFQYRETCGFSVGTLHFVSANPLCLEGLSIVQGLFKSFGNNVSFGRPQIPTLLQNREESLISDHSLRDLPAITAGSAANRAAFLGGGNISRSDALNGRCQLISWQPESFQNWKG
jgi:hypothetical protein